jgi:molybdopterin-binding protein
MSRPYFVIEGTIAHNTYVSMAKRAVEPRNERIRVGKAAELLGVSAETLRRWEATGKLRLRRSRGGQRLIALADVLRLSGAKRAKERARPQVAQSARNRFAGIVTRVEKDRISAVVEVQAGPHRLVSLITAEAATELKLRVGLEVVCVVKATNVVVEVARGASTSL